ncbi:MAG: hypothetical protein R3C68_03950 [Myxococcota bacterium]
MTASFCFSKTSADGSDRILVVVNMDPHNVQVGDVHLDLEHLGLGPERPFPVHDLLGGATYTWQGPRNYVELNPNILAAHIFHIDTPRIA